MAKKRKAYNAQKQKLRVADHILRNIVVAYSQNLGGCSFVDLKKQVIVAPNDQLIAAVEKAHKWSCFIAAFGRTLIEDYMKSESLHPTGRYSQKKLAPVFEDQHLALAKTVPEHQLVGLGWIASPHGIELTEKEAGEIFRKLNAWEND